MSIKNKITEILDRFPKGLSAAQVCAAVGTRSTAERKAVKEALKGMEKQCLVFYDSRSRRYRMAAEGDYGQAVFDGNRRGFGFLEMEEGEDLFVPPSKTNGAFHKDLVAYKRIAGTKDEAEVVKILKRGTWQIVGVYDEKEKVGFVIPDEDKFSQDVFIGEGKNLGARNGQKVVAKITSFPEDNRNNPEGEIVQVLGYPDEKNVDLLSVAYAYGLDRNFPAACQAEAEKMPDAVSPDECKGRRDLRSKKVFTIDGEDAKDLDDAVSIDTDSEGNFVLGVHIADVSHYVKRGGEIDNEAFTRGTSVYFPEMVFPMLPTRLSNGICSLFEGVDRLTLTCEMTVNTQGKVVRSDVYPSVIRSRHRLTYTAVQALFDGDVQTAAKYADIADDLFVMKKLAEILQEKRKARGNIDFQTKEVYFLRDEKGDVTGVQPVQRCFSHKLIEEFMILANESVAEYAFSCEYPFIYRIHEKPDPEKLAVLTALMKGVGINVKNTKEVHSSVLRDALEQAEKTPYFNLINDVMLRTMQKARYSPVNSGHFGLSSRCYCHFTSPIRRYPDLAVHRILKDAVKGNFSAFGRYSDEVKDISVQSSRREKIAAEAERTADDVEKCRYAQKLIGQSFDAVISGVTERGIFCEMSNTVEGFVSVEKLGGQFAYNEKLFCLSNGSVRYCLGDCVRITVESVNLGALKIDFCLQE